MLPNVEYEKSKKQYQVVDPVSGKVEIFPSGYAGRREAKRRAVYFQNSRLYRLVVELVERWPQIESRAWRAAELVVNGSVKDPKDDLSLAIVASSSDYGDYLLAERKGHIVCDCLDYMDGNAPYLGQSGKKVCKHILALQLSNRLSYRHCGSCGRKVNEKLMTCPHCHGAVTPY